MDNDMAVLAAMFEAAKTKAEKQQVALHLAGEGVSNTDIATAAGVNKSTVTRWLKPRPKPPVPPAVLERRRLAAECVAAQEAKVRDAAQVVHRLAKRHADAQRALDAAMSDAVAACLSYPRTAAAAGLAVATVRNRIGGKNNG